VPFLQVALVLVWVSQAAHPPQWSMVFVGVSQPSLSGAALLQSAQPWLHTYEQVVPSHDAPAAFVALQATPQAPQFSTVFVGPQPLGPSSPGGLASVVASPVEPSSDG
jgi:hypothetical protein